MKRYIGLRNIITSKEEWAYLLLYEIDGHDESKLAHVTSMFERMGIAFIIYKTLNGYHFVGLTPLDAQQWGMYFQHIQNRIPEYFSGQTLRLSLKENEKQELMYTRLDSPYLERLAGMYFKRFNVPKSDIPIYGEQPKYSCVFEKYWTAKL